MKYQNKITRKTQQFNSIYQERLRQARSTFNLTLNLLKVTIISSFASILLMYSEKVPPEKVEAAQGIINGIVLITHKITKDANERLDDDKND